MTTGLLIAGAAATGVVITALYLLKEQKRRVEVGFAPLWAKLAAKSPFERMWRKLRRFASWLLHLFVILTIALSIHDPVFSTEPPRHLAILLDVSASMQVLEPKLGKTRFAIAQKRAGDVIAALEPNDRALLIEMGAEPRVAVPSTVDHAALGRSLLTLRARNEPADLEGAVRLAGLALEHQKGEIVVFSDGAHAEVAGARLIRIGNTPEHDLAVTGFAVRRAPKNRMTNQAWVELENFGQSRGRGQLTIETESGAPIYAETIELEPEATLVRILPALEVSEARLIARVKPAEQDVYALNDVAYAIAPQRRKRRVVLVSDGNFFLEGALLLDPAIELERLTPSAFNIPMEPAPDVLILDRTPFSTSSLQVPTLALGAEAFAPLDSAVRSLGILAKPIVTETSKSHPVSRFITLRDVNLKRALRLAPEPGDTVLARSFSDAILIAGTRQGRRFVASGFDLGESDLPLRSAFPVLLVSALDWLVDEPSASFHTGVAGRPATVKTGGKAEVVAPDGSRMPLLDRGHEGVFTPSAPGFHRIEGAAKAAFFAANLSPQEQSSRLGPASAEGPRPATRSRSFRLRTPLLLLAFGLLLLEVLAYHRRVTV